MPTLEYFDVFLSHNSKDKPIVAEVSERLKTRGLKVWLDVEELVPGRSFQKGLEHIIETAASAAILVGRDGLGPWEVPEMRACLQEFVHRSLPVIPVLLPGAPERPELPLFLQEFTWVDMRLGITDREVDRLCWGITGVKAIETSRELVVSRARHEVQEGRATQFVDAWGIASVKSRLHALSEVVAQAASEEAALAAATYQEDILSIIVPITFEMRWRRGYLAAIERILKIPRPQARLADFTCEEVPGGCATTDGVLSALLGDDGRIVVMLDDQPALLVADVAPEQQADVMESVNLHGRLGVPSRAGLSLIERIGEIPIRDARPVDDGLAAALFQNRAVLAALIARHQMPGADWLLAQEEDAFDKREDAGAGAGSARGRYTARELRSDLVSATDTLTEEVFDARRSGDAP